MPFNPNTITKYRKKWFHFKYRTGSPTISHFDQVRTSPIPIPITIPIPIDLDHHSVEYPDVVENDSVQYNEASTNIFSLPPELLATIFVYCLSMRKDTIYDRSCAPINLSQTCRLWRDVALGTPQLWNRVIPTGKTSIDMLQCWLSRARHYPLVLDFTMIHFNAFGNHALAKQVKLFHILPSYVSSAAELHFSDSIPSSIILRMEPSHFPRLRSVRWFCSDDVATDPVTIESFEHFWAIAGSIPSLQSATIDRIPLAGPWNQLIRLHLLRTPISSTIQMLPQCTQLKRLEWSIDMTASTSGIAFPPLVIPHLQHLTLKFLGDLDPGLILDCLTLPSVHHISISIRGHPDMLECITRLLHRSNARLRSFELRGIDPNEQASLVPFFQAPCFNTLRRVVIENGGIREIVWAAFSQATFLPSLEDLQLCVNRDLAIANIVSYLRAREFQGNKLARVVFFVYCMCDLESKEVREGNTPYSGCKVLHPPWNTFRQGLQLLMDVQVIPWGYRPCFRRDVNNV